MREILFRGQTRKKGERVFADGTPCEGNWVYGGLFQGEHISVIYSSEPVKKYAVCSDTVGQYTGLKDKNGKRIFEGDILEIIGFNMLADGRYCVEFDVEKERAWIMRRDAEHKHGYFTFSELDYYVSKVTEIYATVIGNIHDNPDLFEGAITHEE